MKRVILIILLAVFFRFFYLNSVPNSVNGDELHYIITAKSVALTGRDISGSWNPWSLLWFRYPPQEHQAELPYILHLISDAPFPFSMALVKLSFAILSVGIVLLLYAIASELFGSNVGIATAAIAAVNPWLIVMGRSAYEATPAMFFYLLSLWSILRAKKWKILWTIIPLLLAFYSYIATKVIFVPFVAGICLFAYMKHGKIYVKQYLILCFLAVFIAVGFYYLTTTDPSGSRLGELFSPRSPAVADAVNQLRKTTIASPLLSLLVNKYTVYTQILLSKLFRTFSASYLFVEGDQIFLPVKQGFFYWLDAVFLFIGTIWMYAKHKKYTWALWTLVIIATIPQLISTTMGDFSTHLTMLFPLLLPFIGAGIAQTVSKFSNKFLTIGVIMLLYVTNVSSFVTSYFFQYPLQASGDYHKRVIAKYLNLMQTHNITGVLYSTSSQDIFSKYLLYNNKLSGSTIADIRAVANKSSFTFQGVQFTSCDRTISEASGTATRIADSTCDMRVNGSYLHVSRPSDAGTLYRIYHDKICSSYTLTLYPSGLKISDFAIETLPEDNFCRLFINR